MAGERTLRSFGGCRIGTVFGACPNFLAVSLIEVVIELFAPRLSDGIIRKLSHLHPKGTNMKVLLIAIGTRGDVQPFVVLGHALAARGHDVSIAAANSFSKMIDAAGLRHCMLPVDFQELMQEPEIKAAMTTFTGKLKAYRWASEAMNDQLDTTWAIGQDVSPDLILHHPKGALAPYLARKLGAYSVPVMLQPGFVPTGEYPQFLIASRSLGKLGNLASHRLILAVMRFGTSMMVNRWRKASLPDLGSPMDPLKGYSPKGNAPRIHAYSEAIVPRPANWPKTEVQTGYFFAEQEPFTPPESLKSFLEAGPPPVYFGFGSMPDIYGKRIEDAVAFAVEQLGLRAVIATGWGGITEIDVGENVHVLDAVPHAWLFPRVSAVVHHGGSGTTHEGLRWGRASVVCPLFGDQPFFGQRVANLGAGPPPVAQKRMTAEKLTAALKTALSGQVRDCAAAIGIKLRAEDGVARACDLVEHFAFGR